ncbi:hypothetical protein ACFFOM_09405 [Microlunatus capsulatus]|uniref:TIGR04222 domain-containing membrane protein n=1 Tax=Microlunatus capsulatus TaxID=99117 RepID=A0ABS4ZBB1_9ACTN|nr:hypothetical protein [Microlunatus capsulatus]MBP2418050.1 hypothetical protein [Microlunatus capsulatus]
MGTTGVIFGAIAIAWLAYLVPHFVRRREEELVVDETDPAARFSESMRVVRHGTAPLLNQDLSPIAQYEVSTPLTRRAAIHELRRLEQVAASRRRRVLLVLLALLSAAVGVAAAGTLPWGLVAVPGALLLAFLTVARFSVRTMRRELDARFARIRQGSDTESTVRLSRKDLAAATSAPSKAVTATSSTGALWDPVPITVPTYVSRPLAPRTVRTIDLSGPGVASSARQDGPVTADAPAVAVRESRPEREDDGRQAAAG